jgi:hypothetical protein
VADVGEELRLQAVESGKLLVLNGEFVFEAEFIEAALVIEVPRGDADDASQRQEVKIVEQVRRLEADIRNARAADDVNSERRDAEKCGL